MPKIENGALSLDYEQLQLVASGFGQSLSEFLAQPDAYATDNCQRRVSWVSKTQAEHVDSQSHEYFYLCTDLRLKQMVPVLPEVKARSIDEFGPMLRDAGEEFVFEVKAVSKSIPILCTSNH